MKVLIGAYLGLGFGFRYMYIYMYTEIRVRGLGVRVEGSGSRQVLKIPVKEEQPMVLSGSRALNPKGFRV